MIYPNVDRHLLRNRHCGSHDCGKEFGKEYTDKAAADDSNAKEGETAILHLFVALYNEDGTFLQVSDITANKDERAN